MKNNAHPIKWNLKKIFMEGRRKNEIRRRHLSKGRRYGSTLSNILWHSRLSSPDLVDYKPGSWMSLRNLDKYLFPKLYHILLVLPTI